MEPRKEQTMKRTNINLRDEDLENIKQIKEIYQNVLGLDFNSTEIIRLALLFTARKYKEGNEFQF